MTKVLFESGKFWLELDGENVEIVNPEIHIRFWEHGNLQSGDSCTLPEGVGYTLKHQCNFKGKWLYLGEENTIHYHKKSGSPLRKVAILHLIEQPKESDHGWIKSSDQLPEENVGVLVLIPEEDNHVTTGMWDLSKKWVLLDEYRVPTSQVTHWRPIDYDLPDNLEYKKTWVEENELMGNWNQAIDAVLSKFNPVFELDPNDVSSGNLAEIFERMSTCFKEIEKLKKP